MLQRRDAILLTGRSPLSRQSQPLREHCDARPRHCELMSGPVILRHTKVREMTPRIRLLRAMLIGICLQALTGYMSGATLAAAVSQAPPIHAGLAPVWFLRQFELGESLATPIISTNVVPVGESLPGTVFLRDLAPGIYTFTVPSYGGRFRPGGNRSAPYGDADPPRGPIAAPRVRRRRRQLPARHSLCTGNFAVLGEKYFPL
jgi:hypothetical protein